MTNITNSNDEFKQLIKLPKLVSNANAIRIHIEVNRQPRIKGVANYIDIRLVTNLDDINRIQCVVCSSVCVFPLVLNCGHLICNNCYIRHFQFHHFKRFHEYYTNCPKCKAFINSSEILTITQELSMRSDSKVSLAFKKGVVKCDNQFCDQMISFDNWSHHVKFECKQRNVQCPASGCPIIGFPDYVISHSIQCPFHFVWCAGCRMNWTVLATGHNCEKSKEYAKHNKNLIRQRRHSDPENGALILPYRNFNEETPDITALEKVHTLILNYSSEEVVPTFINSFDRPSCIYDTHSRPLFQINEDTQFPN